MRTPASRSVRRRRSPRSTSCTCGTGGLNAIDILYGVVMSDATQVAFQIDNDRLAEIDDLVSDHVFRSRAEALRAAVGEFLAHRREARIDAQLEAGYGAHPQGAEEAAWANISVEGLRAADLEW